MTTSMRATASPCLRVVRAPTRAPDQRDRDHRKRDRADDRAKYGKREPVARRSRFRLSRAALCGANDLRDQHPDHSTAREPRDGGETTYPKIVRPFPRRLRCG